MTAGDTWGDGPEVPSYKPPADLWSTGAVMFSQGS